MKTKSFLTALVMLASTVLFAQGPGSRMAVISQKQSGSFKVIYEGEQAGNVTMTIRDAEGNMVFKETTRNLAGFIRPVNFKGMIQGEYAIEVADARGLQVQKVSYNQEAAIGKVTYKDETAIRAVHVSRISGKDKYLLAVASQGPEKINVRIFDGLNQLVHDENMSVKGDFGLVYNLKNVSGMPTFEVTDKAGHIRTIKYQ